MYQIKTNLADPYQRLINQFVATEFPRPNIKPGHLLVDILTDEILGTKLTRFGPKPGPESLVAIRDVIRHWVSIDGPIPFVVPWGSEKPNGTGIDIAELCAMKTMACLNSRVSSHYAPGAVFNIRVEDVSAPHLFYDRMDAARREARLYSDAFEMLPPALDMTFIRMILESRLTTERAFNSTADTILPWMEQFLENPNVVIGELGQDARTELARLGWSGDVSGDMRAYYYASYEKLYPGETHEQRQHRLARYLSGALARKQLGLRGNDPAWGQVFLELAFLPPTPGVAIPFQRRVYYRTAPTCVTTTHMAPWRSKGYLSISNENDIHPRLSSFREEREYVENVIQIESERGAVYVKADYVLE